MDRKEYLQNGIGEKLYSTPFVDERLLPEFVAITFGNTGFDICFTPKYKDYSFDFIPEAKECYDADKSAKYAIMLCSGLLEFHNLLNNEGKIKEFKLNFSRTKYASAMSNEKFINAMLRLFSKSNDKEILRKDGDLIEISIERFKNLKKDDPLLEYLNKISKSAKDIFVEIGK